MGRRTDERIDACMYGLMDNFISNCWDSKLIKILCQISITACKGKPHGDVFDLAESIGVRKRNAKFYIEFYSLM